MKYLVLLSILFLNLSTSAQNVKGRVVAQRTAKAIPYVNLTLLSISPSAPVKSAKTDSLGRFEFIELTSGKYELSITAIGYQKFSTTFELNTTLILEDILLIEEIQQLRTVSIAGIRQDFITQNGQQKIQVSGNPLLKSSINVWDVLQKMPGIQVNSDGTIIMGNRNTPGFFVDGKPSNMSTTELIAYLSSLSPELVESIELINQPSSKYDAEYKAIIDISLKRNLILGVRGMYGLRFQQNQNTLIDNNLNFTYKTNKFMYGLNLGHTRGNDYYHYHALQYLSNGNGMITETERITGNNNLTAQLRVAYEISKRHELEAFLRTYQMNRRANTDNDLLTQSASSGQTLGFVQSKTLAIPKQYNYAAGIVYDFKLAQHLLRIQGTAASIDNRQTEDIQNHNVITNRLDNYWITNAKNKINISNVQADYSWNLNNGKLETGLKWAYTQTQNDLRYDTLAVTSFVFDKKRSNTFGYKEYIAAGYIGYTQQWGKISGNISLRTEYTKSVANSISTGTITARDYIKWLPNVSMTYAINKSQQLHLSWSSRLTRPTFEQLNPFRFYFSPRNYWIGNPYLLPSTTNQLAFTYSKKAFLISITAGREKDQMARYPIYNTDTHELAFLGDNLPYRDFASLQGSLPFQLTKWWRTNHSLGLFYNQELRLYLNQTYQIAIYNYTINGSQVFNLSKWTFDVTYNYESKSGNSLYVFAPVFTINFGLQRSWFNNKMNTKLNFNDIFDGGQRRLIFREKTIINNDFYHDGGAQRLVFSLNYNFGKSTFSAREYKRSEEENRANRP